MPRVHIEYYTIDWCSINLGFRPKFTPPYTNMLDYDIFSLLYSGKCVCMYIYIQQNVQTSKVPAIYSDLLCNHCNFVHSQELDLATLQQLGLFDHKIFCYIWQ